uniref:Uncharacterized protein n=1 Tax=Magallana gigas TaxID=29159 RepID=K1RE11_MAGGI
MIACVFLLSILFSHVNGKDKAILDIVMHKSDRNGEYTTEVEKLLGYFTTAGSMVSAEGQVFQDVAVNKNYFTICCSLDFK